MNEDKSLEEQMLEAICQAHWNANASDSKSASAKCAIIAWRFAQEQFEKFLVLQPISVDGLINIELGVILKGIEHCKEQIKKLETNS